MYTNNLKKVNFILSGVYIEITSNCNLRCKHCYNSSGINNFNIKKEKLEMIISELEKSGANNLVLSGGEPFLHEDFWDILESLKNKKLNITLVTNATLINFDIAKKLSKYNINIQISLDGSTAEIHDSIRGKKAFSQSIDGINNLMKFNMSDKIIINYVINKYNKNDIESVVKLITDLNLNTIKFKLMLPFGRGKANINILSLNTKEIRKVFNDFNEIKKKYNQVNLSISQVTHGCPITNKNEDIVKLNIRIDSKGDVYPCQLFESKKVFSIGNIHLQSIDSMLNSEKIYKLREFLISMHDYNEHCDKCLWNMECEKSCPAITISNGVIDMYDSLCVFRKEAFSYKFD